MTTQTVPMREYTAKVLGVSKQQRGDGWMLQTEARPGMKFPDSFYGKDWDMVKPVQPGTVYVLQLERGRLRKDAREGSANAWDYWENPVAIRPATAQEQAAKPAPAAPQAVSPPSPRGEFRTPEQIIRCVALEHATALAVALIGKGADTMRSSEVMLVASKYEAYIATGERPAPVQAPAPQQAAIPQSGTEAKE